MKNKPMNRNAKSSITPIMIASLPRIILPGIGPGTSFRQIYKTAVPISVNRTNKNKDLITVSGTANDSLIIQITKIKSIVTFTGKNTRYFFTNFDTVSRTSSFFSGNFLFIINPSCYHRKLMEAARTNGATLSSKPRAVTA